GFCSKHGVKSRDAVPRAPGGTSVAPWLARGLVLAGSWFVYVCSVGLPNRIRGDAFAYLSVMADADSVTRVLRYAGERTFGFPLFLYAILIPFELVTPLGHHMLAVFVNTGAVVLLLVHVAVSVLF